MFEIYLKRWDLTPDGDSFVSHSGHLLPVRRSGMPAMLKLSSEPEELAGNRLMVWWNGKGAAPVLAHDDDATRILCATAAHLHRPRDASCPPLVPLAQWFDALLCTASSHGRFFENCARIAGALLASPRDVTVLHGDIHHGNVLDFGPPGWLAIDPKGLYGERAFDYANLFCNPDGEGASVRDNFGRRLALVADLSGIERRRLLQWVLAWTGLSALWMLEDGNVGDAAIRLETGKRAAAALGIAD